MTTLNCLLKNITLAEVETNLALMIENRTFSEQGQLTLVHLNQAIENCRVVEQNNNTIPFIYDFDFYKVSVGVVELKMNVNQDAKMNIATYKFRLLWEITPKATIDEDQIEIPPAPVGG